MSKHSCTVVFSGVPSGSVAAAHLNSAAEVLGLKAWLQDAAGSLVPATETGWSALSAEFRSHEYTGEVRWRIGDKPPYLDGTITYPISPPVPIRGTVEFGFAWCETSKKQRVFGFCDLDALLAFLLKLANGVSADGLVVEPKRLPPAVADERYARFRRMGRTSTLSSIDWITGLRDTDPQYSCLQRVADRSFRWLTDDGFAVVAFFPQPVNLALSESRLAFAAIEQAFFASDSVERRFR